MQNRTATLELNLVVPYIDKQTAAILYHTYNPEMPLFVFMEIKACQYEDLYANVHRSLTQNSPKPETT